MSEKTLTNITNTSQTRRSKQPLEIAGGFFHFIGAGGIGMSGLAKLLMSNGAFVSGSDAMESEVTQELRNCGAEIHIGHLEHHLGDEVTDVVVSAAIKEDNPELILARQRGCRIYKYAQMLGEVMNCWKGVAIAGTHGKSSTTGWLVYVLQQAGVDASFIVGADVPQVGGLSGQGGSDYFVAEACEYDRSFLNLKPFVGCILNIEADHLDYYRDAAEIVEAFSEFAAGVRTSGMVIVNGDDERAMQAVKDIDPKRVKTFGLCESCDYRAAQLEVDGTYSFDLFANCELVGQGKLSLPGLHSVYNALAVIAMADAVGVSCEKTLRLLSGFEGVTRRLTLKGEVKGITVLDDYAHHPTEIRATLKAIRERYDPRRLICVFQPHQYSRTRFLLDDFAKSFNLADLTIVPDIYFVRDSVAARKEVNAEMLVERIRSEGANALFLAEFEDIVAFLKKNMNSGDLIVSMGAGDIWKVADETVQWLRDNS